MKNALENYLAMLKYANEVDVYIEKNNTRLA